MSVSFRHSSMSRRDPGRTSGRWLGRGYRHHGDAGAPRSRPLVRGPFNHAGIVLPALVGGLVSSRRFEAVRTRTHARPLSPTMFGAAIYYALNVVDHSDRRQPRKTSALSLFLSATHEVIGEPPRACAAGLADGRDLRPAREHANLGDASLRLAPLHDTRAQQRFVEMREMFTQTIGALAEAVDKRDPTTSMHSRRVMMIASDIGHVMRCNAAEMEALEWGGLLHDVGKIGVPDHVLLKADRLTREERTIMNSHPVLGAQIISPGQQARARVADHPAPP